MQSIAASLRWLVFAAALLCGVGLGYCSSYLDTALLVVALATLVLMMWCACYVAFQKPPRADARQLYTLISRRVGARSGNSHVFDSVDVVLQRIALQRGTHAVAIACHDLNAPLARIYVIHSCGFVHKTLRRVDAMTITPHPPKLCVRHLLHHLWMFLPIQAKEIRQLAGGYELA